MAYKNLNELRKKELLCDIDIEVEEDRFSAHRIILSSASKYFNVLFTGDFIEKGRKTIEINDVNSKTMEILLNHIYNNTLDINSENVEEVFRASDFLDMHLAKEECSQFLINALCEKNCIEMLKLGTDLNDIHLQHKSKLLVLDLLISGISKRDDFLELSFITVQSIFVLGNFLGNHEQLFNAIIDWVNFNLEERKLYLGSLLKCVIPGKCNKTFFKNTIVPNPVLKKDIVCYNWIMENVQTFIQ